MGVDVPTLYHRSLQAMLPSIRAGGSGSIRGPMRRLTGNFQVDFPKTAMFWTLDAGSPPTWRVLKP